MASHTLSEGPRGVQSSREEANRLDMIWCLEPFLNYRNTCCITAYSQKCQEKAHSTELASMWWRSCHCLSTSGKKKMRSFRYVSRHLHSTDENWLGGRGESTCKSRPSIIQNPISKVRDQNITLLRVGSRTVWYVEFMSLDPKFGTCHEPIRQHQAE